jgi:metallo-beta-lactamase family protein
MKLEFQGAARTVTGSSHIVQINGARLLLDCGLYQGKRKEAFELNRALPFRPEQIHNVVLSHAHIDHSGNLPQLTRQPFAGRIFCTAATADLCGWMLKDSAHIQERDVEYVNKKRKRKGQNLFEPLYTMEDATRSLEFFDGIPYGHEVTVAPGVRLHFEDAGHILGSAITHLEFTEGDRRRTLVYTGDVGRKAVPILKDPVRPRKADLLITESTYGNRLHEPEENLEKRLEEVIVKTRARGGKILIPAFSVGRTQTVVFHLHRLFLAGRLPPLPIFVDSPLSTNITGVFRAHPECYDRDTLRFLSENHDPFGFDRLTYVASVEESKALNNIIVPSIIISASGMMESGRVLHHLKRLCVDPRNTILIVGFMAENTLGRRVEQRVETIRVFGEEFPLAAEVEVISGFSGHADRNELAEFLSGLEEPPEYTFVVHGEKEQSLSFAARLREMGFPRVEVPERGQKYRL